MALFEKITLKNAEQYQWGQKGTGWFLFNSPEMTIVEESLAKGVKEIKHYHEQSWQFFYIISGTAKITLNDEVIELNSDESIEVAPLISHQLANESDELLRFLIISKPNSFNDRVTV